MPSCIKNRRDVGIADGEAGAAGVDPAVGVTIVIRLSVCSEA